MKIRALFVLLAIVAVPVALPAWDHDGHRMINRLALAALPAEFPAFARTPEAMERIQFLANVPDRWRNVDPWLKNSGSSWTDHFCDIEYLRDAGLDPRTVTSLRYEFALVFAAGRAKHADKFPALDPARNLDRTNEWPGFSPWAITEWFQKLRSAFSYLKAFEEVGGTPEEIANAKADVIYTMGVIGHYIGDAAQPLHTTKHHNGWVGPNPNGYTTWPRFHSWIDGGFVAKAKITADGLMPRVAAAETFVLGPRADGRDPCFVVVMDYFLAQHDLLEPLYKLEKAGLLGHGEQPITQEGRDFIEGQLLTASNMLARVWVTAWQSAPVDAYLRTQLAKRQVPAAAPADKSAP